MTEIEILSRPTMNLSGARKILQCAWPEARKIFDGIQKQSKRSLPGNRILTKDFCEKTGIKKEDFEH